MLFSNLFWFNFFSDASLFDGVNASMFDPAHASGIPYQMDSDFDENDDDDDLDLDSEVVLPKQINISQEEEEEALEIVSNAIQEALQGEEGGGSKTLLMNNTSVWASHNNSDKDSPVRKEEDPVSPSVDETLVQDALNNQPVKDEKLLVLENVDSDKEVEAEQKETSVEIDSQKTPDADEIADISINAPVDDDDLRTSSHDEIPEESGETRPKSVAGDEENTKKSHEDREFHHELLNVVEDLQESDEQPSQAGDDKNKTTCTVEEIINDANDNKQEDLDDTSGVVDVELSVDALDGDDELDRSSLNQEIAENDKFSSDKGM